MKTNQIKHSENWRAIRHGGGFTLIETIVTVALVAGLAALLLLPAVGRVRGSAPAAQCLNNFRQLGVAWSMYSSDTGSLIESHPWLLGPGGARISGTANPYSWAPGFAGVGTTQTYGPSSTYGNTNPAGLKTSVFYKYYNALDLLKCPSDYRFVGTNPILRSYSMNNWMFGSILVPGGGQMFTKPNQITRPSDTFVMIDEDSLTLDDSMFHLFTDSRGFVALPGRRHNNGYSMNYADGRAEIVKLRDAPSITASTPPGGAGLAGSGNSSDYRFLTNAATYPAKAWEN